jgi:hypothetical protein
MGSINIPIASRRLDLTPAKLEIYCLSLSIYTAFNKKLSTGTGFVGLEASMKAIIGIKTFPVRLSNTASLF